MHNCFATTSSLEQSWKDFAGENASIAYREHLNPPDDELHGELQALRSIFTDPIFSARYLEQPQFNNDSRAKEWAESRRCLIFVLKELLGHGFHPSNIQVSLSHCKNFSISVAVASSKEISGVGVDVERADRKISTRAASRFYYPLESKLGISELEAWVIKEACYKSDPANHRTVIADYFLTSRTHSNEGEVQSSKADHGHFRVNVQHTNDLVLGFSLAQTRRVQTPPG